MLTAIALSIVLSLQPAPAATAPGLTAAQWQQWESEIGLHASRSIQADDVQRQLQTLKVEQSQTAARAADAALPDYITWSSGERECWLTTGTAVYMRRLGANRYAVLASASQETRTVTVRTTALHTDGRFTFDVLLPWGPCREAVVVRRGDGLALEPMSTAPVPHVGGVRLSQRPLNQFRALPLFDSRHPQQRWAPLVAGALEQLTGLNDVVIRDGMIKPPATADGPVLLSPRVMPTSEASANADADLQLTRLAKREQSKPPPPPKPEEFDPSGTWQSGDGRSVLRIATDGKGGFTLVELTDERPRTLRMVEGTTKRSLLKLHDPISTLGAVRLHLATINGEPALVADSFSTLQRWNNAPAQRPSLPGVWRRVSEPVAPKQPSPAAGAP